jgi:serpin B
LEVIVRTGLYSLLVATAALAALACSDGPTAPARITALPRALTAAEQRLIAADNRFAFKLLHQAAAEMRETLELEGMALPEVNEANRSLIALLRNLDPRVKFNIANSIWYRPDFTVEQSFLDANRTYFDARVDSLDFAAPGAAQTINNWLEQQTNGLIPDIVPSPLPDGALMYLINAIYFKGNWTQQFDNARTRPAPFRLADGTSVDVPTMTHGKPVDVRVAWDQGAQIADLPYGGRAFSMTIVVPHDPAAIDALVASLTAEQWNGWIAGLDATTREVFLPKFKLTNDLSLVSTLKALGMQVAFNCEPPDMADFARMTPQRVCITNVKHKSYVDVNEDGTEAAAATSVEIGPASLPPTVTVERPFVFALRENLSGTILFLGVVRNPAAP